MRVQCVVQWEYEAWCPETTEVQWVAFTPNNSRYAEEQLQARQTNFSMKVWDCPVKILEIDALRMTQFCKWTQTTRKLRRVIVLQPPQLRDDAQAA